MASKKASGDSAILYPGGDTLSKGSQGKAADEDKGERTLSESEAKYHQLFLDMAVGFSLQRMLFDTEGNPVDYVTLEVNKSFEAMLGVKAADVVGKKVSEYLPPQELKEWLKLFGEVVKTGEPKKYTQYSPSNNKTFEGIAYRLDECQFAVTFNDVTEMKLEQEIRYKNEELLLTMLNANTDYVYVKDRQLRTIICNDMFAKALGKKSKELVGKTDIENGWDPELVKGNPQKGIRGFEKDDLEVLAGKTVHTQSEQRNVAGNIRLFDTIKSPLKDGNGEVFGILGISRDITDRKKAVEEKEKSLHDLDERMKELQYIYELSNLVETPGISLDGILQGMVELILPAWEHPEVTCGRIVFENDEFKTKNFKTTQWKQSADIKVHGKKVGAIEVYYLEEKPPNFEGPFLKEERHLIDVIAERLGRITERKKAEEEIKR